MYSSAAAAAAAAAATGGPNGTTFDSYSYRLWCLANVWSSNCEYLLGQSDHISLMTYTEAVLGDNFAPFAPHS